MKNSTRLRTSKGASLLELLIVALIFSLAIAVIGELVVLITMSSVKVTNQADALAASKSVIERISNDVRQARAIGDYYGSGGNRLTFPSARNPIYAGGRTPAGGWPGGNWSYPMELGSSTLILQIPVFYKGTSATPGFPIMLPKGHYSYPTDPMFNVENLDTVVYQVVPDPDRIGEFMLQVAVFPGVDLPALGPCARTSINPPQTILKGLIGPRATDDPTGNPAVFSYLSRPLKPYGGTDSASRFDRLSFPIAPISADKILGVAVDLEIKKTNMKTGDGRYPQTLGIHSESYMRSNRSMEFRNTTETIP